MSKYSQHNPRSILSSYTNSLYFSFLMITFQISFAWQFGIHSASHVLCHNKTVSDIFYHKIAKRKTKKQQQAIYYNLFSIGMVLLRNGKSKFNFTFFRHMLHLGNYSSLWKKWFYTKYFEIIQVKIQLYKDTLSRNSVSLTISNDLYIESKKKYHP